MNTTRTHAMTDAELVALHATPEWQAWANTPAEDYPAEPHTNTLPAIEYDADGYPVQNAELHDFTVAREATALAEFHAELDEYERTHAPELAALVIDSGNVLTVGDLDRYSPAIRDAGLALHDARKTRTATVGLFVNVGAVLDGTLEIPTPDVAPRTDGAHLFYRAAHNGLTGDPESGKSLLALSVAADELFNGGKVFWLDLDHNGAAAIVGKFRAWGVPADVLRDTSRFVLCITDDREDVAAVVAHAIQEKFTLSVIDSVGELLSLYGASPDSEQDYTPVNRAVMAKLASAGLCVISIDHMAKGAESRAYGATGTIAKKRAMDGAYYAVEVVRPFVPGEGGKSRMLLLKDRHGGVRASVKGGEKRPQVATFELIAHESATHWKFHAPTSSVTEHKSDLELVSDLSDEQRSSVAKVKTALGISTDRAGLALRQYRELNTEDSNL